MAPAIVVVAVVSSGCAVIEQAPPGVKRRLPIPAFSNCADTTYPDWKSSPYVLPYPVGDEYLLIQGNCTQVTHHGDIRFGYDFQIPIGTPIIAARSGRVEEAVGRYPNYNGRGKGSNVIVLRHRDGTRARYDHLDQGGALVEVGDLVRQGDVIGRAGSTGLDPGDIEHLHFHVQVSKGRRTLPVTFRNTAPNPDGLMPRSEHRAERYDQDNR